MSDDTTRFTKKCNPIQLKKNRPYEIALVNLETYYSIPNINNTNNSSKYSANGGADWHVITIPTGSYDIEDINDVIQRGRKSNGHWDEANEEFYVSLLANPNTMKAILNIENNYQVNFKKIIRFEFENIFGESRIRERSWVGAGTGTPFRDEPPPPPPPVVSKGCVQSGEFNKCTPSRQPRGGGGGDCLERVC